MANWEKIEKEFKFLTSRSSGAGGQHVNKVETRVRVCFDISNSTALIAEEKALLFERLKNKIDKKQKICVSAQNSRTQLKNKQTAKQKLIDLLRKALQARKIRKKTKSPASAIEKRLLLKKNKSELKSGRRKFDFSAGK